MGLAKELLEAHGKSPDAMASSKYVPGSHKVWDVVINGDSNMFF